MVKLLILGRFCYSGAMNICPICGYNKLERPPFQNISSYSKDELETMNPPYEDILGIASYEECPVCKFEPGADDNPGTKTPISFAKYREEWKQTQPKLEN